MLRLAPSCLNAGYMNLATAELCARWIAVGAWQPFARVHHAQSFQELYRCFTVVMHLSQPEWS